MATFTIAQQAPASQAVSYLAAKGITATGQATAHGIELTVADADEATARGIMAGWYPLPAPVKAAITTFQQAAAAGFPPTMTAAQNAALHDATWVLLKYLNRRLDDEPL